LIFCGSDFAVAAVYDCCPGHVRFVLHSLLSYQYGLVAMGRYARSDFHCREAIKAPNLLPSKKQQQLEVG